MSDLKERTTEPFRQAEGPRNPRSRAGINQNLADIAASAHGRVKQLIDHPDTELVDEEGEDQARSRQPAVRRARNQGRSDRQDERGRRRRPGRYGQGEMAAPVR